MPACGAIAIWDHCLSPRYWCLVRSRFGAWVLCGRVVVCDTEAPVSNVKVSAFDVDWLQDDPLGSAITDTTGKFRIDYLADDFKRDVTHAVPFGFPGAHGGPGFGFFGNLKLMGDCPTTYPTGGPPMRYRFLYEVLGSGPACNRCSRQTSSLWP
jgi:hypothetical protein